MNNGLSSCVQADVLTRHRPNTLCSTYYLPKARVFIAIFDLNEACGKRSHQLEETIERLADIMILRKKEKLKYCTTVL